MARSLALDSSSSRLRRSISALKSSPCFASAAMRWSASALACVIAVNAAFRCSPSVCAACSCLANVADSARLALSAASSSARVFFKAATSLSVADCADAASCSAFFNFSTSACRTKTDKDT